MRIFAVGDLHLSFDPRIEKPMDIFGEHWQEHWKKLEDDWRERVDEEDLVLIAGDISWGLRLEEALADLEWINRQNGKKVIIKGNHDLWWSGINRLNKMYSSIYFLQNTCYMVGELGICGTRGWICPGSEEFKEHDLKIYEREIHRLRLSLEDARKAGATKIVAMLHYPPTNDRFEESGFTELLEEYQASHLVYGHLHGKEVFKKGLKGLVKGINYDLISLDYLDFKLKLLGEF